MANSLHDQLLKAGLVNKHQVRVARKKKQKQKRQHKQNQQGMADKVAESAKAAAEKEKARVRQLNQQKKAEADRKANLAQIKQLIAQNLEVNKEANIDFNFADGNKIKRLLVTSLVHKKLSAGQVAIVATEKEHYAVVPRAIADKIRLRDARYVIFCNELKDDNPDEDEYPDHQIPDDLIW